MKKVLSHSPEQPLARLRRDLTPFADPGTRLDIVEAGRRFDASWQRNGQAMRASFAWSITSGLSVTRQGQTLPYTSYLASTEMADLASLAKAIERTTPAGFYVEAAARCDELAIDGPQPAAGLVQGLLALEVSEGTQLLFVTGDAGAGKTRLLRELVARQARAYLAGSVTTVFLYINAQGRALARFNEALATELQDLRAPFTYHVVATLVRNGLVVPLIDGFDELIGVSGYDDAFNSLAAFIDELNGEGRIVASARSAYYEEEFVERSQRNLSAGRQSWRQWTVRVQQWEAEQRQVFVEAFAGEHGLTGERRAVLARQMEAVFRGANAALGSKPLFVARVADLLAAGVNLSENPEDLLDELVGLYLQREGGEKLLDRNGQPLLSVEQLKWLMAGLAEEMWQQETRELDRRTVRDVAEFVLDESTGLGEAAAQILVERMPMLALLTPGETDGSVAFEHETFFGYFLAWMLAGIFERTPLELRMVLSRAPLPREVAQRVASHQRQVGSGHLDASQILTRLTEASRTAASRATLVQENGGLLAFETLRGTASEGALARLDFERLIFAGMSFQDWVFRECRFSQVQFKRCDLSATRFEQCQARELLLQEPVIDPTRTKLDVDGLRSDSGILGLRIRDGKGWRLEYDPHRIAALLQKVGLLKAGEQASARAVAPAELDVLERLMRAYHRANLVCSEDENLRELFANPAWPNVLERLLRHGVLSEEQRQSSGRAKAFYRRQYLPDRIMAGVYANARVERPIELFWQDMEMLR